MYAPIRSPITELNESTPSSIPVATSYATCSASFAKLVALLVDDMAGLSIVLSEIYIYFKLLFLIVITESIQNKLEDIVKEYKKRGIDLGIITNVDEVSLFFDTSQYAEAIKKKVIEIVRQSGTGRAKIDFKTNGYVIKFAIQRGYYNRNTIEKLKSLVDYLHEQKIRCGYEIKGDLIFVMSLTDFLQKISEDVKEKLKDERVKIASKQEYTKYIVVIKVEQ
ncbi:hypothetical protein AFV1_ORF221 [Captovirus AFV1]|uniref:Uncharacterized protein ORF221 n=1 Tax=Acidianus filamentous virus 1 (isolate United States/Yellowstone) TaxID=654909 RepID=Y221_AFV1Y|nr:hypothetical protein AFV1_ORF221 [Captovirus AFV1]Q70LC9.1 RecName: Full=Uncharacterized protein ORF221 [Acidianus filamentous virus 1 (isolate Yellowstone)]CAD98951.1 hypothetical protein [Captovirus AFV1]